MSNQKLAFGKDELNVCVSKGVSQDTHMRCYDNKIMHDVCEHFDHDILVSAAIF